jgi:hypothetical protein
MERLLTIVRSSLFDRDKVAGRMLARILAAGVRLPQLR